MTADDRSKDADWTAEEVAATVADYFHMLTQELSGQQVNKAAHRRALLPKLNNRSEASIEFKHQNISAVLQDVDAPWIIGYKPRANYQGRLFDAVVAYLKSDRRFDSIAVEAMEQEAVVPLVQDYSGLIEPAPAVAAQEEPQSKPYCRRELGIKRDYLAMEARNRSLGAAGEEFIVGFERHRLHALGARKLADRVERVSETRGDGLGYDVLSFEANGKERLIEVKTTAFGAEAPFYVSRTELALSKAEPDQFRLYRLYKFKLTPRMFELRGAIDSRCMLDPVSYLARFS